MYCCGVVVLCCCGVVVLCCVVVLLWCCGVVLLWCCGVVLCCVVVCCCGVVLCCVVVVLWCCVVVLLWFIMFVMFVASIWMCVLPFVSSLSLAYFFPFFPYLFISFINHLYPSSHRFFTPFLLRFLSSSLLSLSIFFPLPFSPQSLAPFPVLGGRCSLTLTRPFFGPPEGQGTCGADNEARRPRGPEGRAAPSTEFVNHLERLPIDLFRGGCAGI